MKISSRSKKIIMATLSAGVLATAVYFLSMKDRPTHNRPILKLGDASWGQGLAFLLCDNGTMFEERTDALGKDASPITYVGQLSPKDLAELKSRLGVSFSEVDQTTAPPVMAGDDNEIRYAFGEYTGGGSVPRKISYHQLYEYAGIIGDFESRAVPAKAGEKDTSTYWRMRGVISPSVDCMPR